MTAKVPEYPLMKWGGVCVEPYEIGRTYIIEYSTGISAIASDLIEAYLSGELRQRSPIMTQLVINLMRPSSEITGVISFIKSTNLFAKAVAEDAEIKRNQSMRKWGRD